jgi:putative hydrolase of the HAD superfamily
MFSKTKPSALVFDWGNTLMKELAEFNDLDVPMVEWPRVEAVPGIESALASLKANFRIFLGTNAQQSTALQVQQALKRVDLDSYFEKIFTFNETHARKPETLFFRAIERMTGEFRDQMVLIGDLYNWDVVGAKQAGWKAVWYNPRHEPCPGCLPFHDIEIDAMGQLPAALDEPLLPEVHSCLLWLQENGASAHLLTHVQQVAAIAYVLSEWLRAAGMNVNPILAHRGGLLHDLAKATHHQGMDHGQLAGVMLRQKDEPALADIADHHMLFTLLDEVRMPRTWEQKLVYYADKLVEKNELVSVDERLAGLQERYRIDSGIMFTELTPRIKALEAEICNPLSTTPGDLLQRLFTVFSGR